MTRVIVEADALIFAQAGSAEAGDRARPFEAELTVRTGHATSAAVRRVVAGIHASPTALGCVGAGIGGDWIDWVTA